NNTYYSILHFADVSDTSKPFLLSQRLLADGGGIAGFPRQNEAPATNGAVARGFGVLPHVDITHTRLTVTPPVTSVHADTHAVYTALKYLGVTLVDLDLNIPEILKDERKTLIESEGLYTLPYYEDVKILDGKVIAVAGDRSDGSDLKTLEVFPLDLS